MHGALAAAEFDGAWPAGLPLQVHTAEPDPWVDLDIARGLVSSVPDAELFVYPGAQHLFTDRSLPDHDPPSATLVMQRMLGFLSRLA